MEYKQLKLMVTGSMMDAVVREAAQRGIAKSTFLRGLIAEATGCPDPVEPRPWNPRLQKRYVGWAARRKGDGS